MSKVPVPEKRNSADSLENFARRIEERLRLGKDASPFAMERLICRLLTGKDVKVAAVMAARWVEWRYGKPTQTVITEERPSIDAGADFFRANTARLDKPN